MLAAPGDTTGQRYVTPEFHERGASVTSINQAAADFLENKRIAITGVSREPQGHGSNTVYQRLRSRGYEVFAVNPNADEVEGDTCYHDLKSIPDGVDAVVIGTRPEHADAEPDRRSRSRRHVNLRTGSFRATAAPSDGGILDPGQAPTVGG